MAMSTGYRRNYRDGSTTANSDLTWTLIMAVLVVALFLIGLPAILIGVVAQYALSRFLSWRSRFLLWFLALIPCVFLLYTSYQHGLQQMITHELIDYVLAARRYQTDLTHWPVGALWAVTWSTWIHTLAGAGLVGFWQEINRDRKSDTASTLHQHEKSRQHQALRAQQQAQKRARRPAHLPDAVDDMMVVGAPIDDDTQEEA
jgi:hypothetical protein